MRVKLSLMIGRCDGWMGPGQQYNRESERKNCRHDEITLTKPT